MASSPSPDSRILVLGLCDPTFPDGGPGAYLARSLRLSFPDVEVVESPPAGPDFPRILREYDVVILLDCISMCSSAGQVFSVSPYALAGLKGEWNEYARALDHAIHDALILGHEVPAIHIVAVCMPDRAVPLEARSPVLAAFYRAVVPRTRQMVRDLIRDARGPSTTATATAAP